MTTKTILIITTLGILLFTLSVGCGSERPGNDAQVLLSFKPVATDSKTDNPHMVCGGIAAIQCPEGYYCEYTGDGSIPDAGGNCRPLSQHTMCQFVKCMKVTSCPKGFHISRGRCCSSCVPNGNDPNLPDGKCHTATDCSGLIHIMGSDVTTMCVGSWSCNQGYCQYSCGSLSL